ncbi:hypothetical protein N7475_008932 [Penicillium sp. IBT 31633x]|nr:hypothetical protein N7475_008932 [Penicillium sp. IBT 31633x]
MDYALGPNYDIIPGARQRSIVDDLGLDLPIPDLVFGSGQVISTLEDVIRDFYQSFEPVFRLPFSAAPLLCSKPNGPEGFFGSTPRPCYQLTWARRGEHSNERTAMIGLFTAPGSIAVKEWIGLEEPGQRTQNLLQEMKSHGRLKSCLQCPHPNQTDMPLTTTALESSRLTQSDWLLFHPTLIGAKKFAMNSVPLPVFGYLACVHMEYLVSGDAQSNMDCIEWHGGAGSASRQPQTFPSW